MEYCKKEIKKMMKQLPKTENSKNIEENLIEMAEDKYQELLDEGMDIDNIRKEVINSVCLIEDIREALGSNSVEKEYYLFIKGYWKKIALMCFTLVAQIVVFFVADYFIKSELLQNLIFIIFIVSLVILLVVLVKGLGKKNAYRKILDSEMESELKNAKYIMGLLMIVLIIICVELQAKVYIVLCIIALTIGIYYLLKYIKGKNN